MCLAMGFAFAEAADAVDIFDSVRSHIRERLLETSTPSAAVAVARSGKVLWEEGIGWADREKRIPATGRTAYSLASISKPLTATGLMRLVEDGRIRLDRPINDYLRTAKLVARAGRIEEVTVRRVAGHTAGLPLHGQYFYADERDGMPSVDETIRRYG